MAEVLPWTRLWVPDAGRVLGDQAENDRRAPHRRRAWARRGTRAVHRVVDLSADLRALSYRGRHYNNILVDIQFCIGSEQ